MRSRWLPVVGWRGRYIVSSDGRVMSLDRLAKHAYGTQMKKGVTISCACRNGYPSVTLYRRNKGETLYVHRLVLTAFLRKPRSGEQCNHKNRIRTDNRIENLEWVTSRENNIHCYRNDAHGQLTPVIRVSDGRRFRSLTEAANAIGGHASAILKVCKGALPHHHKEKFIFATRGN